MVDRVKGVEKVTDNPFLNLYNFDVEKRNGKALLPIVVFVVLYLGLGILFEYGLDIEMDFIKFPLSLYFWLHYLLPVYRTASLKLDDKLEVMGMGIQ